jgi:hypothetical protein
MIQKDGLSTSWIQQDIMPFQRVSIEGAGNWTVRLGPRAHAMIMEEYQVPETMTLGCFSNQRRSDSTWRTKEVRHAPTASG